MITIIAGINGAGKSSVAAANMDDAGGFCRNPDEVARDLMEADPKLSSVEANARAWKMGRDQLVSAIESGKPYTLETTLGGNSICQLLHEAIDAGRKVRIFFVGLASPELHIARVAARVARGGHDIPEDAIRKRWHGAMRNMMGLIPRCAAIAVVDNSTESDNESLPQPRRLFSLVGDRFVAMPVDPMPDWAKPLASVAIKRALDHTEVGCS